MTHNVPFVTRKYLYDFLENNNSGWPMFDIIHKRQNGYVYANLNFPRTEEEEKEYYQTVLEPHLSSREAYLKWVEDWKECYKWLAVEIRTAKRMRKKPTGPDGCQAAWQERASFGRQIAHRMIRIRKWGKILSWEKKKERGSYELTETCKTNALTERLDITY